MVLSVSMAFWTLNNVGIHIEQQTLPHSATFPTRLQDSPTNSNGTRNKYLGVAARHLARDAINPLGFIVYVVEETQQVNNVCMIEINGVASNLKAHLLSRSNFSMWNLVNVSCMHLANVLGVDCFD